MGLLDDFSIRKVSEPQPYYGAPYSYYGHFEAYRERRVILPRKGVPGHKLYNM